MGSGNGFPWTGPCGAATSLNLCGDAVSVAGGTHALVERNPIDVSTAVRAIKRFTDEEVPSPHGDRFGLPRRSGKGVGSDARVDEDSQVVLLGES